MVRKPEKGTGPKIFYIGADESIDPARDRRAAVHVQGRPGAPAAARRARAGSAAARAMPRVDYDVPHSKAWGIDLVLYLLFKGISTGAMFLSALLWLLGDRSALVGVAGPVVSLRVRGAHGGRARRRPRAARSGSTTSSRGRTGVVDGAGRVPADGARRAGQRCGCLRVWIGWTGAARRGWRLLAMRRRRRGDGLHGVPVRAGTARAICGRARTPTIDLLAQAAAEGSAAMLLVAARRRRRTSRRCARWRWTLAVCVGSCTWRFCCSRTCSRRARRSHHELAVRAIRRGAYARLFWGGAIGLGGVGAARARLARIGARRVPAGVARCRPPASLALAGGARVGIHLGRSGTERCRIHDSGE